MLQRAKRASFGAEADGEFDTTVRRFYEFDGTGSTEAAMLSEVDDAHPTDAELMLKIVLAIEERRALERRVEHNSI
jgi:hypothetical protein